MNKSIRLRITLPDPGFAARILFGEPMERLFETIRVEAPQQANNSYIYLIDVPDGSNRNLKVANTTLGIGAKDGYVVLIAPREAGTRMRAGWAVDIANGKIKIEEHNVDGQAVIGFAWMATPGPLFSHTIVGGTMSVEVVQAL